MNYEETLAYLYTQLPMFQRQGAPALKFSLDNTLALMAALDDPQDKIKTVHIAGTNGKGSTAHMIASVMQQAGYKTGLYTSPHLKSFTERIKVDGRVLPEEAVVQFVSRIKPVIETIKPSFFEITFAMAMDHFARMAVDLAVIEVGMGGRLDSTNVITPELCLITNISMDHQQFLGDTLVKIAGEKAGIIKKDIPVVISQTQEEVVSVFTKKAASVGTSIYFADQNYSVEQAYGGRFNIIKDEKILVEGLKPDLKGSYQKYNLTGVFMALDILTEQGWQLPELAITTGLENVITNTGLKGRWQQLGSEPLIIADTGHNESGVAMILAELETLVFDDLHMVWGMVNDKDISKILAILPRRASYYFVRPEIPRGLPATDLMNQAATFGLEGQTYDSVNEGIMAASQKADSGDLIFIGGSTFVVAEIPDL